MTPLLLLLLLILLVGFVFGYVIVGPFNRGYSALEWAGVMMVCGTMYGILLLFALVVPTYFAATTTLELGNLGIAAGFTTLYALAASVGAYLSQKKKGL